MSTAIKSKGVSLSAIFDPYVSGTTKARASGLDDAGNDLSNLYANIIYGTAAAATGIASESADLNTLYAKIGTTNYPLPIDGDDFIAHSNGTVNPSMDANIAIQVKSDGTYSVKLIGNSVITPGASGTWLPSGDAVSDYQVEYVWTQSSQRPTGPATVTNGASTYSACTTTRTLTFDAQVGQHTGLDQGSIGTVTLNLKKVSTGRVTATTFGIDVESAGSG